MKMFGSVTIVILYVCLLTSLYRRCSQARHIALNPVEWNVYAYLKYELYGCEAVSPAQSTGQNVTQDIEDNQVFVTSLSPYIIDRAIHIRPEASLTIQAGVRVLFTNTEAKLVVYGRLRSDGLEGLRVVFSHNSLPLGDSAFRWDEVEVKKGSDVMLTNTDIWQAQRGLRGDADDMDLSSCGVYVSSSGIVLTSGKKNRTGQAFTGGIVYGCGQGIELSSGQQLSHFLFRSYEIVNNLNEGIITKTKNCGLEVENSQISDNRGSGISVSGYSPLEYMRMNKVDVTGNANYGALIYVNQVVDIRFCSFRTNKYYGVHVQGHTQALFAVFQNNSFEHNGRSAVYLRLSNVTFTGNTLTRNGDRYAVEVTDYRGTDKDSCVISGNILHDNYAGVYIRTSSNVTFSYNFITGTQSKHAVYVDAEWVLFTYNEIVNNSAAVFIKKFPQYSLSMNTFINPESEYEIDTNLPFSESYFINAAYNYWGSSNGSFVRSRVRDAFINIDLVLIFVSPFFVTSDLAELYTGQDPDEFTQDDFTIGGRLVQNVTLRRNTSFSVTRSIYVPEGISLMIEPGVELRFPGCPYLSDGYGNIPYYRGWSLCGNEHRGSYSCRMPKRISA
ncbi:uncharacterized protein LOC135464106 [Liolophura sinensis]|uniref:uncharacterized protein LOC135464106 n=1 Tax=Liolophura sinensis TaxID=3198878 RepID=UPI003158F0B6